MGYLRKAAAAATRTPPARLEGWQAFANIYRNFANHLASVIDGTTPDPLSLDYPGIESFWSYAKFRMAKLRGVQKEKFLIHLKESEWRFNHRSDSIYSILLTQTRHFPL